MSGSALRFPGDDDDEEWKEGGGSDSVDSRSSEEPLPEVVMSLQRYRALPSEEEVDAVFSHLVPLEKRPAQLLGQGLTMTLDSVWDRSIVQILQISHTLQHIVLEVRDTPRGSPPSTLFSVHGFIFLFSHHPYPDRPGL